MIVAEIEALFGLAERLNRKNRTLVEVAARTLMADAGKINELRKERDALAAWLDECLSAMRHASEFLDEFDKDAALALYRMNSLSSRSRGPEASLTARDARMKAEALEPLREKFQRDADEAEEDGDVTAQLHWLRTVMHVEILQKEYRKQAEGNGDE